MSKELIIFSFVLFFGFFLYTYKLGYEYFFVDEVVYSQAGLASFKGDYTISREVLPIGKLFAGISATIAGRDIFLLRLPFALLAVLSAIFIFFIVRKEFDDKYALLAVLIFYLSPFIHQGSRMVMLEPIMHFFWLGFHFSYLNYLNKRKNKYIILTGIFLGLSLVTKIPSIILLPFFVLTFLMFIKITKKSLLDAFFIGGIAVGTVAVAHLGLLVKEGSKGIVLEIQNIYDKYFSARDQEGKTHVVNGVLYQYSPWWYYFYYLREQYTIFNLVAVAFASLTIFFKRNRYVLYWTIFLLIDFGFFQILGVKASRYIASIELPLIFLLISFLSYSLDKIKNSSIKIIFVFALLIGLFANRMDYLVKLEPTKYNALKTYLIKETGDFKNGDRTLIFGSIRGAKWSFEEYGSERPDKPIVVRKDEGIKCDYSNFKYLAVDREEALKAQNHPLMIFISLNKSNYTLLDIGGLDLYVKNEEAKIFNNPGC